LWSDALPKKVEKQFAGIEPAQGRALGVPHWQVEARESLADLIQHGKTKAVQSVDKAIKRSGTNAKRAWREYHKLGLLERYTKKGRRVRARLKRWERVYVAARAKRTRLQAVVLVLGEDKWE